MDGSYPYPGSTAGADDIIRLAETYRRQAHTLLAGKPGVEPLVQAPCRLCAVHAIELYFNAYLLKLGHAPDRIRRIGHDLAARTELAIAGGLVLRQRTARHLAAMTLGREYLVLRYEPRMPELAPLNRLWATLDEVARKVTRAVVGEGASS